MKIWIRHFFGRCSQPASWYDVFMKRQLSLPGDLIYLTKEEFHWWVEHASQQMLGGGVNQEKEEKRDKGIESI